MIYVLHWTYAESQEQKQNNVILLEQKCPNTPKNSSRCLENEINHFITPYNTRRYHESLNNLTQENIWLGRGDNILAQRKTIQDKILKP